MLPWPTQLLAALLAVAALTLGCTAASQHADPTATPAPPTATPTPPGLAGLERWPESSFPLEFCLANAGFGWASDAELREAVELAFEAWDVPYVDEGPCVAGIIADDGINQIGWEFTPQTDAHFYEAGYMQGVFTCSLTCEERGGRRDLNEADIGIDAFPPEEFRTRRCLFNVVLHEVGHFLGLNHLPPPAAMQTGGFGCPITLTDLDRRAFDIRYPRADGAADHEIAVIELITLQFELFRSEDWEAVYPLYSQAYRALCPIETFLAIRAAEVPYFEPDLLGFENLRVTVEGDVALATYTYTYGAGRSRSRCQRQIRTATCTTADCGMTRWTRTPIAARSEDARLRIPLPPL